MDFEIESLNAREILDSRGNPTLEVECVLDCGVLARAGVPSGASTGSREALELRDGDNERYGGKGVEKAIDSVVNELAGSLFGMDARDQSEVDYLMLEQDGTPDKSKLGANAILGVSLAVCRAASMAIELPLYRYIGGLGATVLPVPCMNVLNGGAHARWQGSDFQEYMIAPYGAESFREALRWGSEIYQSLRTVLLEEKHHVGVGDEGGFAPSVASNREPLELIVRGIEKAGFRPGADVGICLDAASTEFFKEGEYRLNTEKRALSSADMVAYYQELVRDFPICLIEDGLSEDDWDGWAGLNKQLGNKIELVGDDLFVTNVEYIARGLEQDCANAALIKLNQIGTLTETIDAIQLCQQCGWGAFVSHRSGETADTFIADLSVGLSTGHIKTGAPCRSERVEKYNQLLRIEEELGDMADFAGQDGFIRPVS